MTRFPHLLHLPALLFLAACASTSTEPPISDELPAEASPIEIAESMPEPEPPPEPDKSALRLTIAAVGDMMIGTDYPQDHLPDDDGVSFLTAVAPTLSAADVAFGNLEGVLAQLGRVHGGDFGATERRVMAHIVPSKIVDHGLFQQIVPRRIHIVVKKESISVNRRLRRYTGS